MKLLTAQQMRELDRCAIEDYAVPGVALMENAGCAAAQIIADRYAHLPEKTILIVAGKGNNGGDGYVIARHLENKGWQAHVLVLASRQDIHGDAAVNLTILENVLKKSHPPNHLPASQVSTIHYAPTSAEIDAALQQLPTVAVVADAIFGNGLNTAVRGHYLHAIEQINNLTAPVVAIDLPSGIDATTGAVFGCAVRADCSISFACAKLGQVSYPASDYCGELYVVDIGIPRAVQETISDNYVLVEAKQAQQLLPLRPSAGHKGTFGHVLVVAGCAGKSGAAQMCASACLRSGCGLTTLATVAEVQAQVAGSVPEIMTEVLAQQDGCLAVAAYSDVHELLQDKTVLALGPGLGQSAGVTELVARLIVDCHLPLVLDADGLNALQGKTEMLAQRTGATVVTPHPGEMARLTGLSVAQIQDDRCGIAAKFASLWQSVVVLKGARTVIAAPDGRVWINNTGNSGMGSGGMGDILTGVVAGLLAGGLASGLEPFSAAALGVYLHGAAGDNCQKLFGGAGYLASDLLPQLPVVRQTLAEKE